MTDEMLPSQLFAPRPFYTPWPKNTEHIPYKSTKKGEGNGEGRVAFMCNTTPRGQNSPYDLLNFDHLDGTKRDKGDVKEDDKGTFNTGKEARIAYRPIARKIDSLLVRFKQLGEELGEKDTGELCVAALKSIVELCSRLLTRRLALESTLPSVKPMVDGDSGQEIRVAALEKYRLCMINGRNLSDTLEPHRETLQFLDITDHEYILDPTKMMRDLNDLRNIFKGVVLFFVSEEGYHVVDSVERLQIERITLGGLRFRVLGQ
jgi:hypothetical protein